MLRIWRVRGGGFYGLGYVIAFVVLEVRAFVGNFEGDGDITSMIAQEVLGFFFRFAAQSFLNGFIAFGWPIFVVDASRWLGTAAAGSELVRIRSLGETVDQCASTRVGGTDRTARDRAQCLTVRVDLLTNTLFICDISVFDGRDDLDHFEVRLGDERRVA